MNPSRILTLSMYALVIVAVAVSLFNWRLLENPVEGPIYNGTLDNGWLPESYLTYKALTGRLSYSKFTIMTEHYVGVDQTVKIPSNTTALTLTTLDTGWVFYLLSTDNKLIPDNKYSEYLNKTVYIQGNAFNYQTPDGKVLHMIEPIEVSAEPVTDLVKVSDAVIKSIVGDKYFNTYFSRPVLWKDDYDPTRVYRVDYVYEKPGVYDNYRSVSLYYNSEGRFIDQEGVPDEGSLQPFKVTEREAVDIARANGFPKEGDPTVRAATYTHPQEWPKLDDSITLQTFFDPDICANAVNLTHYLWHIQLSMPSEDDNTTVYKYAIVDTKTGALYVISEYNIAFPSIWIPI